MVRRGLRAGLLAPLVLLGLLAPLVLKDPKGPTGLREHPVQLAPPARLVLRVQLVQPGQLVLLGQLARLVHKVQMAPLARRARRGLLARSPPSPSTSAAPGRRTRPLPSTPLLLQPILWCLCLTLAQCSRTMVQTGC